MKSLLVFCVPINLDFVSDTKEVVATVADELTDDSSGLDRLTSAAPVTVVIPAFNEAETIGTVIEQLQEQVDTLGREVIVVDDV